MKGAQQIFREVYESHFGGDYKALSSAICSFAATLAQPERDILLQCELGGRSAQSVGAEVGLCRRQVQRYRKIVRSKFVRYVRGSAAHQSPLESMPTLSYQDANLQRRAVMLSQSLRGEPAKATAERLGISVRTLWRERARIRETQHGDADDVHRRHTLERILVDIERSWFRDDYAACLMAAQSALAIARGVRLDGMHDTASLLFRTYIWSEVIERTVGSARLADAYLAEARKAAAECTLDARQKAFLGMRELAQLLRDPAGYARAYERTSSAARKAMPAVLADIIQAEVFDALEMQKKLTSALKRAAAADIADAPRSEVARTRTAVLAMCLRPGYERLARRYIADVRAWARPDSRSALLAEAYEAFIFASRNITHTLHRLQALASHFRQAHLPAEVATVHYLAARLCVTSGDVLRAGDFIEESLDAGEGRVSAKMQRDLLRYGAHVFGGRHRRCIADAFTDAMSTAQLHIS